MAPMKRKAGFATRSAAKKSRTSNLVPTVVNALVKSHVLPENLRILLKSALPIVLNQNKADRHAYETEVVNQAQQALTAVQAALQQEHDAALAKQNKIIAPAEEANRKAAKTAAEAHLEATKAQVEANKAAKKAAEHAAQDAEDAVKAAGKEDKAAEKELHRHVEKKTHLADALSGDFAVLRDGTSASAEGKKAVNKMLAIGKEFGLDSTLLYSFPIACKKQAASRSEFEAMMFNNLSALIEGQINVQSQHIAEAEPVKAAKDAALAGAKQHLEAAEAASTAAGAELEASQTANRDASKDVHKADHHVKHIWEDMREVCDAQDHLAAGMKNLKENVWAAFNALKEKEPEPEPVEEAVAEVPEPVEEAVAAVA